METTEPTRPPRRVSRCPAPTLPDTRGDRVNPTRLAPDPTPPVSVPGAVVSRNPSPPTWRPPARDFLDANGAPAGDAVGGSPRTRVRSSRLGQPRALFSCPCTHHLLDHLSLPSIFNPMHRPTIYYLAGSAHASSYIFAMQHLSLRFPAAASLFQASDTLDRQLRRHALCCSAILHSPFNSFSSSSVPSSLLPDNIRRGAGQLAQGRCMYIYIYIYVNAYEFFSQSPRIVCLNLSEFGSGGDRSPITDLYWSNSSGGG